MQGGRPVRAPFLRLALMEKVTLKQDRGNLNRACESLGLGHQYNVASPENDYNAGGKRLIVKGLETNIA